MEIIYGILDSPPERPEEKTDSKPLASINTIEFKNISFGYDPSVQVLKDVSLYVSQGETLGLTGQSGSGKTTLARLLFRFYEPDSGEIMLNGLPLARIDLDSLRSSIGIAFQENLILNSTIKENIAYGNDGISMENIIRAAKISRAHDFVKSLPDQYETVVGEGGKSLSGGERQRLAIARAIITNPEILILDEATSFLEIEQEEIILQKLKETRKSKITLIISHRLSAIKMADRILTLDNGRIIETDFRYLTCLDKNM
jgi:ATP-binding cassette subfamily B protein